MKSSSLDERIWSRQNPVFYGVLGSAEFFAPTGFSMSASERKLRTRWKVTRMGRIVAR
jgi:hypothetical protein